MKKTRVASLVAYIGSFLQSYSTCIIACSLLLLSEEFSLSPIQQGKVASSILLGAIFGTLLSGFMADFFGRKPTILFTSSIFFLMGISSQFITTFSLFIMMRFITGVAVGISSMVVPIYLAEIAPAQKRGAFVSGYELSITLGILAAYIMGHIGTHLQDWRIMYLFPILPAAIQILFYSYLSRSPSWLSLESKAVLTDPRFRPLLIIGLFLSIFQQLCGFNAVLSFAPKIFLEAGFGSKTDATFASIFVGLIHAITTFIACFCIDKIGRRKLLLLSQVGVLFMLILMIFSFSLGILSLSISTLLAFIMFYSVGIGPVVWVLISEIFPLPIRAKAVSFLTFISWSCSYLMIFSFPQLLAFYGAPGALLFFAVFSLIALTFYMRLIPETRGKTLEELEPELGSDKNN